MFNTAKIYHITAITDNREVSEIINSLSENAICELKESSSDLDPLYSFEDIKRYDELKAKIDVITNSIYDYEDKALKKEKALPGKEKRIAAKRIVQSDAETIEDIEHHLSMIEPKVLTRLERQSKIKDIITGKRMQIANLEILPNIQTDFLKESESIHTAVGLVFSSSLVRLRKELSDIAYIADVKKDDSLSLVMIFTFKDNKEIIEKCIHSVGFEPFVVPYSKHLPVEAIKHLKKEIEELESEMRELETFFSKLHNVYSKKLAMFDEEIGIMRQKVLALNYFKTSGNFTVLEAWVPEKALVKFHELIKTSSRHYYISYHERPDAPTLLENPKLIKPFEILTELYSFPKYRGFDPTPLMAVSFPLFFGYMLTDAAYGMILLLAGLFLFFRFREKDEKMKDVSILVMMLGSSTIILGVIFGSYFGDFFQKLGYHVLVPIDSMKQALLTLLIAISIGMLHLLTGLISGFYDNMRQDLVKDAFAKQGVWILFIASIVCFIFKANTIGLIILSISIIMQLTFNYIDGGLVPSALSIFGYMGFIGDASSYARLAALAISTSGIALAVNFMCFMAVDYIPLIGIPVAAIIFIIGHLFNTVMNSLGGFVHSTRLHFLEFFTKFYDGGGTAYKPFAIKREYTTKI